jgi:hypothetical protein
MIDSFSVSRMYSSLFKFLKYEYLYTNLSFTRTSWVNIIQTISRCINVYKVYKHILVSNVYSYYMYDNYISTTDYNICNSFIKHCDISVISSYKYINTLSILMYLSSLKILVSIFNSNIEFIFYCSFLYYDYPYLLLILSNRLFKTYLIGYSQNIYSCIFNIGLSILSYNYIILCSFFNTYSIDIYNIFSSTIYISKYSFYIFNMLYSYMLSKLINYILVLDSKLNICNFSIHNYLLNMSTNIYRYIIYNSYSILMLYNNIYFELLNLYLFKFDIDLNIPYLSCLLDIDTYIYSKVSIQFTSYISNFIFNDIVLPIKIFIELNTYICSYSGNIEKSKSILIQNYTFSIYNIFKLLLIYTGVYIKLHEADSIIYTDYTNYYTTFIFIILFLFNYRLFSIIYLGIYIYIKNSISYIRFMLNYYIYNVVNYLNLCKYICTGNIYYSYYLDSSTFFLTGSVCKKSLFLSRFIRFNDLSNYNM